MIGPKLVLPSQSMPWGRWLLETQSSTDSALSRVEQEVGNSSATFSGQASSMAAQIEAIPSLAGITQFNVPDFTVSRPVATGTFRVWDSPSYTINPPRPDKFYTASVIAVMNVSGVPLFFARSYLRINGVDDSFSHENNQGNPLSTFSIMGTRTIGPGEALSIQFAVSSAATGTASFNACRLYAIFNGRIS